MRETSPLEDLERAAELAARAFGAAVPEQRSERALKYAEHLIQRFGLLGRQGALTDAIAVLEQAPPDAQTAPAVRVRWLELAGHAYLNRHRFWGVEYSQDVRRAQDCFQQALKLLPPSDPTRIPQLLGLAEVLEHSHRPAEDRELPIELLEQAVAEATESCHGTLARLEVGTALAARARGACTRPDDRARAIELLEQALAGARADPSFSELPDEVVSLPAALLQVGFSAVVASQWAVAGLPTALLSARAVERRSARAGQGAGACTGVGARQHRRRQDSVRGVVAALARGATNALARGRRGRRVASLRGDRGLGRVYIRRTPRRGPS